MCKNSSRPNKGAGVGGVDYKIYRKDYKLDTRNGKFYRKYKMCKDKSIGIKNIQSNDLFYWNMKKLAATTLEASRAIKLSVGGGVKSTLYFTI